MRTVTALRERPRGHVEIELDGERWRLVPADAVVRAGLVVGRTLDRETARTLARELRRGRAIALAARSLRHRARSRAALEERLASAGVAAPAREEALGTLERVGLVDDARFAEARAHGLAERGWGDAAIRAELERDGVAAEHVAAALAELAPERERARAQIERRGGDGKALRRLAARGFDRGTLEELAGFAEEA
jgi:SOS response regulatory protein OraA/RecX